MIMKKIYLSSLLLLFFIVTNANAQEKIDDLKWKWDLSPSNKGKVSFGCTALGIKDTQGNIYHGRTLEYESDLPFNLTYYPIGYNFNYLAPDNKTKGASYTTKYEILALTLPASEFFNPQVEGINSAGVSASLNMISNASLPNLPASEYSKSLNWALAMEWALSTCGSIEEIKANIGNISFWTEGSPFSVLIQLHYIFFDKTGASLVLEVSNGKLHIIDNPTGVLTNGPEFNWHLTNLNNYTNLTNKDVSTATLGGLKLQQPDTGIATSALPSSNTSVGRFVRAVFYTTFAAKRDNAHDAILELSHIMNKFDRPKNMTLSEISESGGTSSGSSEYSEWTALTDLKNREMYVRTYYDLNYTKYSLKDYTNGKKKVVIPIIKGHIAL